MYFLEPARPVARDSAPNFALEISGAPHTRAQKTVLVPFDRSAAARCALDFAIGRAQSEGLRIHLVNVQSTPRDEAVFYESGREEGKRILDAATVRLHEENIGHSSEVCFGPVASAIIDCATRTRCSLIVIGARTRSALARFFSASVSSEVVRLSPVEVAVVTHTISSSVYAPWSGLRRRYAA
ncbi:MAG: universal stress protein [Usitatibacter sp.]